MTAKNDPARDSAAGSANRAPDGVHERLGGGGGAFRDENLDLLSRVLDTWFRVPGTNIRFGVDGIVGFIPGIGDLLGGMASCIIVLAAYFRGVPLITIARMVANLAIEVGRRPGAGTRQPVRYRLASQPTQLSPAGAQPGGSAQGHGRDWLFMGLLGLGLLALAMLPFLLLLWLGGSLLHSLQAPGWR